MDFYSLFATRECARQPKVAIKQSPLFNNFKPYVRSERYLYTIKLPLGLEVEKSILSLRLEEKWSISRTSQSTGDFSRRRRRIDAQWYIHTLHVDCDSDLLALKLSGVLGDTRKDSNRQRAKNNAKRRAKALEKGIEIVVTDSDVLAYIASQRRIDIEATRAQMVREYYEGILG